MSKKIDVIRELEVAAIKSQIIREQAWKAQSTGSKLDPIYIDTLSASLDEIINKLIINLKKKGAGKCTTKKIDQ